MRGATLAIIALISPLLILPVPVAAEPIQDVLAPRCALVELDYDIVRPNNFGIVIETSETINGCAYRGVAQQGSAVNSTHDRYKFYGVLECPPNVTCLP